MWIFGRTPWTDENQTCRQTMALPFLPAEVIANHFRMLQTASNDPHVVQHLEYMGVELDKLQHLAAVCMVSVRQPVRTNNDIEGWHCRLNYKASHSQLILYKLIKLLHAEANIFSYADDMILLAPSWSAMQHILELLEKNCITYSILCNTKKTVCMVFNPKCVSKIVSLTFPPFTLCGVKLKFLTNFKYLIHIINNKLSN